MTLYITYILRLVLSCVCGIAIGVERKNRAKEAGVRTHCVVACASCLMMLVSIYGFTNLVGTPGIVDFDPTRIAAQIVSGVGFLGAGMIFIKRQSINGLTTAAGIWATAGIGMAIGAGMYVVGIIATVLILITQILLHLDTKVLKMPKMRVLTVSGVKEKNYTNKVKTLLENYKISITETSISKKDNCSTYTFFIEMPYDCEEEDIINLFEEDCSIKND